MMQSQNNKKIAYIALLISLALIFSFVETLIPMDFGIPGVKLGLANSVSVVSLYLFNPYFTIIVVILRVLLSGLLFGNVFSIIYSLAGGLLSVFVMTLLKKSLRFSIIGVSIAGGVFHNIGQIIMAIIVIEQLRLYFYLPILIVSGVVMGLIIGLISNQIVKRVETYVRL